ncbi:3420_t:CDS:1, partial [Dentiscutata erythropus]
MPCSSRQQRGHYATNACTNCRKKHTKCSEESTCKYCSSHNFRCIYVNTVKKRGPKVANRSANVFKSNFNEDANTEQEQTLTLTEYPFS